MSTSPSKGPNVAKSVTSPDNTAPSQSEGAPVTQRDVRTPTEKRSMEEKDFLQCLTKQIEGRRVILERKEEADSIDKERQKPKIKTLEVSREHSEAEFYALKDENVALKAENEEWIFERARLSRLLKLYEAEISRLTLKERPS